MKRKKMLLQILVVCAILATVSGQINEVPASEGNVRKLNTHWGSLEGGTMLRIFGQGFSGDQFSFDDPTLGNVVTLTGKDGVKVPCAVVETDTSSTKISCELGKPPEGHESDVYSLSITVNGEPLGGGNRYTYCWGTCKFWFKHWRTPTIRSMDKQAGPPDQVLKITGRLYTGQIGRLSDGTGDDFDPDAAEITRVYLGGYNCDTNDENGLVYDIYWAPWTGHFKCRSEITAPGSYKVSYLVSNYGRSQLENDELSLVDANDVIYQYQLHSDIVSVEPRNGSQAGGTVLTIKGKAFSFVKENVKVTVGGVPCKVLTSTKDTITCKTGAVREGNEDRKFYPGGRGFTCDTWNLDQWIPDVRNFDPNSTDYNIHSHLREVHTNFATCVNNPSFVKPTYRLVGRLTAYFVPPSSGVYRFGATSDDSSVVYLSNTTSPLDKKEISSAPWYTGNDWNKYDTQWSERMYLEEGRAYYIEGDYYDDHWGFFLNIGLHKETTSLTNEDVDMAVQEQQHLKIWSNITEETQTISYENWSGGFVQKEEQLVTVKQCLLVNNVCQAPSGFSLNYNGDITEFLPPRVSAASLRTALNGLPSISGAGSVTVTLESTENQLRVYRVKFNFDEPETTVSLHDGSGLQGLFVSVVVDKAGINSAKGFRLNIGGKRTHVIPRNATEEVLESTFSQLFTTECKFSIDPDAAYFYQGYEGDVQGYEQGDRATDESPHCGRQALINPNGIYIAGLTVIDKDGTKGGEFNLQQYSRVCYAFRGDIKTVSLRAYVKYTDKSGTQRHVNLYQESACSSHWQHVCVNLNDMAANNVDFWNNRQTGSIMYVKDIYISKEVMVDDVWIGSAPVSVLNRKIAAHPNGHWIKEFEAEKLSETSFKLKMKPAYCGDNIPLISIAGVPRMDSDQQSLFNVSDIGATVTVTRTKAATPPLTGTFDITFENTTIKDIPLNTTAEEMKTLLEDSFDVGKIEVKISNGYPKCNAYRWRVDWLTKAGKQPDLMINASKVMGVNVQDRNEITEGGLFYKKIPGEFLRVITLEPQVVVKVNDLVASCLGGGCSYHHLTERTPVVTNVSSTSAGAGGSITVTGSGFSSNVSDITVTIGNVECTVQSSTETEIMFTLAKDVNPGFQDLLIHIQNKGYANFKVLQSNRRRRDILGTVIRNRFNFLIHIVNIQSVTPSSGGTAGGTHLTITGFGFGSTSSDLSITVGGIKCAIESVEPTIVKCTTGPNSAGVADVIATAKGTFYTFNAGYSYDDSVQPRITSIAPTKGPTYGGIVLTITGTSFPEVAEEVVVSMGARRCDVQAASSTEVTCLVPTNPPGDVVVIVDTQNKGRASLDGTEAVFTSVLSVSSVAPNRGSLNGGTVITISGEGFSSNNTENIVMLGDVQCQVTESTKNEIKCTTPSGGRTAEVDNSGLHPEFGIGYQWKPSTVTIRVGDTVKWSWAAPVSVDVKYGVYQTKDDVSTDYDGTGFISTRSASGSFSHRFNRAGTYYFSSGFIDQNGLLDMKGVVVVEPAQSNVVNVGVKVNEFSARHDLNGAAADKSAEDCNQAAVTTEDGVHHAFTFSTCVTSIVTSVRPASGVNTDIITIAGTGFSAVNNDNTVLFDENLCAIQTSSATELTCLLDTSNEPRPWVRMPVLVDVSGIGRAIIAPNVNKTTWFELVPSLESISPRNGSHLGGTKLIIDGQGFVHGMEVTLGRSDCEITSLSYTQIECITEQSFEVSATTTDRVVEITLIKDTVELKASCKDPGECVYMYSKDLTPRITAVSPTTVSEPNTVLTFSGVRLSEDVPEVTIKIGDEDCSVLTASMTELTCTLPGLPVGAHPIVVHISDKIGYARLVDPVNITSVAALTSISPLQGSINGGLLLTVNGHGFNPRGVNKVSIGDKLCKIISVTTSVIECKTPMQQVGTFLAQVTSNGHAFPLLLTPFATSAAATPVVDTIPNSGRSGNSITIQGSRFSTEPSDNHVKIGDTPCKVTSSTASAIDCTLAAKPAGNYPVMVHVDGKGHATTGMNFTYQLNLDTVSPNESGYGGGKLITVSGSGFSPGSMVNICGSPCEIAEDYMVNDTEIQCEVPAKTQSASGVDDSCDVVAINPENMVENTLSLGYTYRNALTSTITSVSPSRGGTGGGVVLTITGTGFSSTQSQNKVTIDGTMCMVISASNTEIKCTTGQHHRTIKTKVRVDVGWNGAAVQENADFYYVDVWSSKYTWGGRDPPTEGDFVVIDKGQTMVLDVDTPVLSFLLIKGGTFMFDDEKDIHLHSNFILITHGGSFMVGTEEEPFKHKATITIHGHVRSKEIPVYGAKSIALREGYLGLHGQHVPHTWTVIMETINPGDTTLKLKHAVSWKPGDKIVIAPTGKNIREHEEVTIVGVQQAGKVIQVYPELKYKHISIVQQFAGRVIETRAEVGLLTRNVVIQGSEHDDWKGTIKACPGAFEPGQFQTQTCFQGRFGEEPDSDGFGVQIMIHAPRKSAGMVTAHFNHVEVRHAGQAFRIGRYPIHFHISGDVDGSYVKGCSIHHSFNRAVTMHGINNLVVERNVFYNAKGNAFFMEDGIEIGNVIQYNLGIFVTSSTSTLNVDVTPASYWVTNANNTVRHNVAAGGSHFGFWYQMFKHPDGPSYTPDVCPRNVFMLEFRNNTAHSFGRYGLWIFPVYNPKKGGTCRSTIAEPAEFNSLLAYNNMRGAEGVQMGAVRFVDFIMMDNDLAGIEYIDADSDDAPWGGAMIKDSLVVGHSQLSAGLPLRISTNRNCTETGLMLPKSSKLTVSNLTLVNFDYDTCVTMEACAHCKPLQGGWTVKMEKMTFINSPRRTRFKWQHEVVFRDLDGTLTGTPGGSIVPTNENLPPSACRKEPAHSLGAVNGSICDASLDFRRFAFNRALPSALNAMDALLTNAHGTSPVPWKSKAITHPEGWTATVILGEDYRLGFRNHLQITNISYSASSYELGPTEYIRISHEFNQQPDFFTTTGVIQNVTDEIPPTTADHGAWGYNNGTRTMTYLVSGKGADVSDNNNTAPRNIQFRVYRCFFLNCVTPTPPPPDKAGEIYDLKWSVAGDWNRPESPTEKQYGGYGGVLPKDGENVHIRSNWHMIADTEFPKINRLIIHGVLELDNNRDYVLNASIILIMGDNAKLIIGTEENPHPGDVLITLQGDWNSPEMPMNNGPNLGSKAIGVFGSLDIHGLPRDVYWTRLLATKNQGESVIQVEDDVATGSNGDWKVGDELIIASTTFEARQAEVVKISSVNNNMITLETPLQYKHTSALHTLPDGRKYKLGAEVGLLTRNVKIEGADNPDGSISNQDFGCRILVGRTTAGDDTYIGEARIENVEFKHCGQRGWSDSYDPRYALSFLNVGPTRSNESYVVGNSFNYNFNSALGVFGTSNLLIEDNVVYFTIGASIRVGGEDNKIIHNLVVYSASYSTYKNRRDRFDIHWPGAIETVTAIRAVLTNNAIGGSERVGYLTNGEPCDTPSTSPSKWGNNTVHGALHGISLLYQHGIPGCAMVSGFLAWKNYDWGLFFFIKSRMIIQDNVFADNTNSVNGMVYHPPALTHVTSDKFVHIKDTVIIGRTASWDCTIDAIEPVTTVVNDFQRAFKTRSGGNVGLMMPGFMSLGGMGPIMRWDAQKSYPAIYGITKLMNVTFDSFRTACKGQRDTAIMVNPVIGDITHPMTMEGITKLNMDEESSLFYTIPTTRWINPSDCVDMDCDGRRQLLITDIDGSFTGTAGNTIIPKAEYQWGGDPRYGLGDYRIPTAAQTNPDGSRININTYLPNKGIIRGSENQCTWIEEWNAYKCSDMDHHMAIIESLDKDTETRRLSPVAIFGDGYVNLLNGPMDHGWCLGYTCQERISTFYGIVSSHRNYSVYFTNTNPQKIRLHLLGDMEKVVRFAIFYKTTQRLDIYRKGFYINPTNAMLSGEEFTLKRKDPNLPNDQFEPQLSSFSGANYWDRDTNLLYVIVRGSEPVDIRTTPVIQVKLGMKPVSVDEFFEVNLVQNLAALLGIDTSRIRIMNVVSADGGARRRRTTDENMVVEFEIGDPPATSIEYEEGDVFDNSTQTNTTVEGFATQNYTGVGNTTSFEELEQLASDLVDQVQTGTLSESLNISVQNFAMAEPVPEPVDPTGGIRATNESVTNVTGNNTLRYDELQQQQTDEEGQETVYQIPSTLQVVVQPDGANETVKFGVQPKLWMLDSEGEQVNSVGFGEIGAWVVTATIRPGTGDTKATIIGNNTVKFKQGWANFTSLAISHNGTYTLDFHISKPDTANFQTSSQPFMVKERDLYFTFKVQPSNGTEMAPLPVQPTVEVRDTAKGMVVNNTGWKNRTWYATASLLGDSGAQLLGTKMVEFVDGVASFTDLSVDIAGQDYQIAVETRTEPLSRYQESITSEMFSVEDRVLYLAVVRQPADCNDTVACGVQPIVEIRDSHTSTAAGNLGWRGRTWYATVSTTNNNTLIGNTRVQIPASGQVTFADIGLSDIGSGIILQFGIGTEPTSSYDTLTANSDAIEVKGRQYYLVVSQEVAADLALPFSLVVEIRDLGTGLIALPWTTSMTLTVVLTANPSGASFTGTHNVNVVDAIGNFTDLVIDQLGTGYTVQVTSSDGQQVSHTFNVVTPNIYAPELIPANGQYTASLREDSAVGTNVSTIQATDQDSGIRGEVYYNITGGNDEGKFEIDVNTGVVRTIAMLDREITASYVLTVTAYDGSLPPRRRYTHGQLTVTIEDINDSPPEVTGPSLLVIPENFTTGGVLTTLSATDADDGINAMVTFEIRSGNDGGLFALDENTGDLTLNTSIDLDTLRKENYTVTLEIVAKDKGAPQMTSATLQMTITVINVNEFHPQFPQASDSVILPENATVNSEIYQVSASDGDYGIFGTIVYNITGGDVDGYFSIATDTGKITIKKELDRETFPNGFDLTIEAKGFSGAAPGDTMVLHVNITDINDNSPEFSAQVSAQTVSEAADVDDVIVQVKATDSDLGTNAQVSYDITAGNSDDLFKIDEGTGEIKVKQSLDLEGNNRPQSLSYVLTIEASDGGMPAKSSTIDVEISITTENEFTPYFGNVSVTISVMENASVNSEIYKATATDQDYGTDGQLEYSITSQNPAGYFIIDSGGAVTIARALDREVTPDGVTLTIQAADTPSTGTAKSSTLKLIVQIADYNDNTPDFTTQISPQQVSEDASVGDVIVQVKAIDADLGANSKVSYDIIAGNPDDLFEIDGGTGEIKVKQSLDLDGNNRPQSLSYSLTIEARDGGSPQQASTTNVEISIVSVNEYAPVFGNTSDSVTVQENATVSTEVYKAVATDNDYGSDGDVKYEILNQTSGKYFEIDSVSGTITIAQELDRETTPQGISMIIQATDSPSSGVPKSTTMTLNINISDYNDNSPEFTVVPEQTVSENALIGDVIVTVQATDVDEGVNANITYSITSASSLFDIDSETGEIKVKGSLDLESGNHNSNFRYTITVEARDGGTPSQASEIEVTIQINGENEFDPTFDYSTDVISLQENTTISTVVYTPVASDADQSTDGELEFSLVDKNGEDYFSINSSSGDVSVAKQLDYIATPHGINLTITATDKPIDPSTAKTATMDLTINVIYVGNTAPIFPEILDTSVAEDLEVDSVILRIDITDANPGPNGEVWFSIEDGNALGLFRIDQNSGEIILNNSLDLETPANSVSQTLTIKATDRGTPPLSSSKSFTITVSSVNEFMPQFNVTSDTTSIGEEVPVSTKVYQATASDLDYGSDGEVRFSIESGNEAGYFKIDANDGSVTTATILDREAYPSGIDLVLLVQDKAEDGFKKNSTMSLHIDISDFNDNEPLFTGSIPGQDVSELASVGHGIVRVQASDADLGANAEISYSIIGGNSLGYFEINSETGQITVQQSLDLDAETQTHSEDLKYTLIIQAKDNGTPSKSNTTTVEITIISENEFTPQFADSSDTTQVSEDRVQLTEVYNVIATDGDFGPDGQIEYTVISQSPAGYFDINPQSGTVTVARSLDRETTPDGITLTIQAEDKPDIGPAKTATMVLEVEITDVNDQDPVFTGPITAKSVSEDAAVNTIITQLQATDQDLGNNAKISYSITGGNSLGFFDINSTSGEVTVVNSLDLETETHAAGLSYTLIITATDSGIPSRSASESLSITVTSVNEFSPQFEAAVKYIIVAHNTPVSEVVYKPQATDQDFGADGELQYMMSSSNNNGYFTIDQSNGELSVAQVLDFTAVLNGINITITATDKAAVPKSGTMQLNIEVQYVDNSAPAFSESIPNEVSIEEDATIDTVVVNVSATDTDPGTKGEIHYSIISGNDLDFFKINEDTGALVVKQSLDFETKSHAPNASYVLIIQAQDKGTPPLSATKEVIVQVNAVNEFTPSVGNAITPQVLREDTPVNTQVVQVIGRDQDYGDDGKLTFTISGGNQGGYFDINTTTGMIFLDKALNYKTMKEYFLTIRVEDNALGGNRRSVETLVNITISFTPDSTSSDPEVLSELELTFEDADYDAIVLGNENDFIAEMKRLLTEKYPNAIFLYIRVRKGSIIVNFEMITKQSQQSEVLDQISNDVNSPNGLQVQFNGTTITPNDFKQDGTTYKQPEKNDDDNSTTLPVIIGSVAGVALLIGVVIATTLACYSNYKSDRKKQTDRFSNMGYLPEQGPPPSYKSAPKVPSMYSHRPASHARRSTEPSLAPKPTPTRGSNHDILRPSTTTSQPRSAFRSFTPTSLKPPSNIGSYYEPSLRAQAPGNSVASQNPYTSVSVPSSSPVRASNDSRRGSSDGYERLNSRRSAEYESPYASFDRKTSTGGQLSKLNPVFDESLSTAVPVRSGSAHGGVQTRTFYVNLVTQDSGYMFQRLGNVKMNIQGSLKELRGILDAEFGNTNDLKNKRYVFVDNDFNNIEESRERETPVQRVYMSNIKIKLIA